jgi:hypothetical protein
VCILCSELAHPGLLPVVGASKELSNDEDGTIDYLLVSRKCVPLPLARLPARTWPYLHSADPRTTHACMRARTDTRCDITADQLLKQKKDEPLTLEARINWALSIAQVRGVSLSCPCVSLCPRTAHDIARWACRVLIVVWHTIAV